jgi:hypothetical protein
MGPKPGDTSVGHSINSGPESTTISSLGADLVELARTERTLQLQTFCQLFDTQHPIARSDLRRKAFSESPRLAPLGLRGSTELLASVFRELNYE